MPIYGQQCTACGHVFEDSRLMKYSEFNPCCPNCHAPTIRNYESSASQCRPEQVSDALGIHPSQIPAAVARFPHHRFNSRGQMLFSTNAEMQRVLKDIGYADKNRV